MAQTRLARELGVSATPLREVIGRLQAEGLPEVELNRRPRVAPLDGEDLNGVDAARIMTESFAVSLTVPVRPRARTAHDLSAHDLSADLDTAIDLHAVRAAVTVVTCGPPPRTPAPRTPAPRTSPPGARPPRAA